MSELIWNEIYRPKTVSECILAKDVKSQLQGMVDSGNIPSLLLAGTAGVGKTTAARAMANEVGADVLFINASLNNSIDDIRTTVQQFASTVSFSDAKKITILDESDGLSQDSQKALRGLIEQFSGNHSIIFTCNFINKMIDPIQSRCKIIDLKVPTKEKQGLALQFIKRIFTILDDRDIEYEREAIASLVMKKGTDYRSIWNELQGYAAGGKIDSGILANLSEESFDQLIISLKNKKFNECRKWVAEHTDIDSDTMFKMFYDQSMTKLEAKSVPELILQLGEFSYKDYFCSNKEINRAAFLTTIMLSPSIQWK